MRPSPSLSRPSWHCAFGKVSSLSSVELQLKSAGKSVAPSLSLSMPSRHWGGTGALTTTVSLQNSPNHSTHSSSMRQSKGYVPGVVGAVAAKANVTTPPGATLCPPGRSTRCRPKVPLSWGFCEPRRWGVVSVDVQVVFPLFLTVTEAEKRSEERRVG